MPLKNSNWSDIVDVTTLVSPGEIVAALEDTICRTASVAAGDYFGQAIAFSEDYSTLIVGGPYVSNYGALYIYKRENKKYVLKQTIQRYVTEQLGAHVVCSNNGNRILVAGPTFSTSKGQVHIYDWNGSSFILKQTIIGEASNWMFGGGSYSKGIAISGDGGRIAIGTPGANSYGKVGIYTHNGTEFVLSQTINHPNSVSGYKFGGGLAISNDGTVLAVTTEMMSSVAPRYIYTYNGSSYVLRDTIMATTGGIKQPISISRDGNRLAFITNHTVAASVSAKIYNYNGSAWVEEASIARTSGDPDTTYNLWSITISGDGNTVAIGYPTDDYPSSNTGSVAIYRRTGSGTWDLLKKIGNIYTGINNPGTAGLTSFGYGVELSYDGSMLFVGAVNDGWTTKGGILFCYKLVKSTFTGTETAKIVASDGVSSDYFGSCAVLSGDGLVAVVGAYNDADAGSGTGAAYIFTRSGEIWTQVQKLTAYDKGSSDLYGKMLAVSYDGSTIVISAYQEDTGFTNAGSLYVYIKSGSSWILQQKITSPYASPNTFLGYEKLLAISGDGNRILVKPNTAVSTIVYNRDNGVWTSSGSMSTTAACNSLSLSKDGNTAVLGTRADNSNIGAVSIFTWNGANWSSIAAVKIYDPSPVGSEYFGWDATISADGLTIAIACYNDAAWDSAKGSVIVYRKINGTWTYIDKLLPYGSTWSYVTKTCISGDGKLIAFSSSTAVAKFVYVYQEIDGVYRLVSPLRSSDWASGDQFGAEGISFSEDGSTFLAASAMDQTNRGTVYIFH